MRTRAALAVLAIAALLAFPGPALARTRRSPVATITDLDVQYWANAAPGQPSLVLVVAVLPTDTVLPATVRMPLPDGARVTWAGELFGGGPRSDVQRPSKVASGTGGQYLEVVTERSLNVQYEAEYPPFDPQDGKQVGTLHWVQTAPADVVRMGAKLPAASDAVGTDPPYMGQPQIGDTGEKLYALGERKIPVGESVNFSVNYIPRIPGSAPGGSGGSDLLLPALLGALALAVVTLLVVITRERQKRDSAV